MGPLAFAILGPIIVGTFFPKFTYGGEYTIGWWITAALLFVSQAIVYGTGHGYIRSVQIRATGELGLQLADPTVQDILDERYRGVTPLIYVGLFMGLRLSLWLPVVLVVFAGIAGGCIHMFMGGNKLKAFTLIAYYGNDVSRPLLVAVCVASVFF